MSSTKVLGIDVEAERWTADWDTVISLAEWLDKSRLLDAVLQHLALSEELPILIARFGAAVERAHTDANGQFVLP